MLLILRMFLLNILSPTKRTYVLVEFIMLIICDTVGDLINNHLISFFP